MKTFLLPSVALCMGVASAALGSSIWIPGTIPANSFASATGVYQTAACTDTPAALNIAPGAGGTRMIDWTLASAFSYTIHVSQSGSFTLTTRLSGIYSGNTYRWMVDGVDVTGGLSIPNTGSWSAFVDSASPEVNLTAGDHTLTLTLDQGNAFVHYFTCAINITDDPNAAATRIEAENYNSGGEGYGYHDSDAVNSGGAYRTEGVDIQSSGEGGYNTGWAAAGEWLAYSVYLAEGGSYTLNARVATSTTGNKSYHYEMDGAALTPSQIVTYTGGPQSWTDSSVPVVLPPGPHVLKFCQEGPSLNVNYLSLTRKRLYGAFALTGTSPGNDVSRIADVYNHGLRMRSLELKWRIYETSNGGGWDENYMGNMITEYNNMRSQGLAVVLDLGLQYPPQWAINIEPFQDQLGDVKTGAANTIFNANVRNSAAAYIARVFSKLGENFLAVRISGGGQEHGEASYPFITSDNGYWAWSASARAQCPVPNYRPQTGPANQAQQFYDWYVSALVGAVNWQLQAVRAGDGAGHPFNGNLLILCPGCGVQPKRYSQIIAQNCYYSSGDLGIAESGTEYEAILAGIADKRNVVAVCTSIGDSTCSRPETGAYPSVDNWSSPHWMSYIADEFQLPKWGESTGAAPNDTTLMNTVFAKLTAYDYTGLFWAWEHSLYDGGTNATIANYQSRILANP